MARSLALLAALSCDQAGVVTGGDVIHEDCLSQADKELIDTLAAEKVCRDVRDMPGVGRCDAETIGGEIVQKLCLRWVVIDGVERLCYRLRTDPD